MVGGIYLWPALRYGTGLPDSLRDPAISRDSFKHSLKTFLFSAYLCTYSALSFLDDALYKFTYLLT